MRISTLIFSIATVMGLASSLGCRDGVQLVQVPLCYEGQYQDCVGPNGCGGKQRCSTETGEPVWGACEDVKMPELEVCDGKDNDCNGVVDNDIFEVGRSCSTASNMCTGIYACTAGALMCTNQAASTSEVCDGKDNNCDGAVDNIAEETCYEDENGIPGNPATRGVAQCHSGFFRCAAGNRKVCKFQQLPELRNCQNGEDNDCDGHLDYTQVQGSGDVDFVFFMDMSGSMTGYYEPVVDAMLAFARANTSNVNVQYAVVGVPHMTDSVCGKISDFKDSTAIQPILSNIKNMSFSFGAEPTLDCPYLAAQASNPLGLTFRPTAKKVFIMFTDEEAQSYLMPAVKALDVTTALNAVGAKYYSFSLTGASANSYRSIVTGTGGRAFELDQDEVNLAADLTTLLGSASCQ